MEALGWKRSRVRTAIVELSWQDLFAVWLAQSFPKFIHHMGIVFCQNSFIGGLFWHSRIYGYDFQKFSRFMGILLRNFSGFMGIF